MPQGRKKITSSFKSGLGRPLRKLKQFWWTRGWWRRIWVSLAALVILVIGSMYGIAQWYIASQNGKPLQLGVTFIPSYASYLGLNPKETMQAMIDDLGVKHFRLVSYWEEIEPTPGHYDFSQLDWEFAKAQAAGADVSLSIGLRQPRWPECHIPDWAATQPKSQWYPELKDFMQKVIEHYKNNPILKSYQLENEYFLKVFGKCTDFSRDRLVDEFNFVKGLDSTRPTIISRSNNWVGLPIGQPTPDEFAISVYKRVWDYVLTHRYVEYPYPAWYYAFYAGAGKILTGKDLMIHELQAEPWTPKGLALKDASLAEQDKSMNAERLKDRFEYGRATGMKTIELWGAEWWYWRKVYFNDPSLWNVAKKAFQKANAGPVDSFLN